jgi:glycerophosphoryl diester phosphodiesterase
MLALFSLLLYTNSQVHMTKIVGHRGAKGLEHENTVKGFKLAKSLGVDAVELDVLATKDGKIVVCHDDDLKRLTGTRRFVSQLTYAELGEIHLANEETIPLLYDVIALLQDIPLILDVKTDMHLDNLFAILAHYPNTRFTMTAWRLPKVISECKRLRPDIPAFVERYNTPWGLMFSVNKAGADGLNLYYWWMNPFTYWAAKRRGLQIQVYTVNNVRLARFIKKLYPDVWICTNFPDELLAKL